MASSFTWLDYSEEHRRRMLDVVDLFREKGTRDELGVGSVRDAFADLMFPGTSTLMTRAKYFLLIPWTYLKLERQGCSSRDISERARIAEINLIEVIERSDDKAGNIGRVAKKALQRLPSSVYWQGLGLWGIRQFDGSQAQYHRSLDGYYIRISGHLRRKQERDADHDDLPDSNWHPGIISSSENFPKQCSLKLSQSEADYLAERIRLSPATKDSLLAELVGRHADTEDIRFPWEHPQYGLFTATMQEILSHARCFSEVMLGGALLYNLIVSEQAQRQENVDEYRKELREWSRNIQHRKADLVHWDRSRFWKIVESRNSRVSPATKTFIEEWSDRVVGTEVARIIDSTSAREQIRQRERRLKKNLARIDNARAQELWQGASGNQQIEFRWRVTQALLKDIQEGLGAEHA